MLALEGRGPRGKGLAIQWKIEWFSETLYTQMVQKFHTVNERLFVKYPLNGLSYFCIYELNFVTMWNFLTLYRRSADCFI